MAIKTKYLLVTAAATLMLGVAARAQKYYSIDKSIAVVGNELIMVSDLEAEIQLMRFSPRISVDFGEVPAPLRALPTPRLILQPVLENAFEHGMRDVIENGLVRVRFQDEGGRCV